MYTQSCLRPSAQVCDLEEHHPKGPMLPHISLNFLTYCPTTHDTLMSFNHSTQENVISKGDAFKDSAGGQGAPQAAHTTATCWQITSKLHKSPSRTIALSRGDHIESQENKKLCFCTASLALNKACHAKTKLFIPSRLNMAQQC